MFAAVASFSGLLDTMTTAAPILDGFQVVAGQNPNAPWGAFPGTPAALLFGSQWPDHNPTLLAPALVGVPLFVSAGNGTSGTLPGEVDDGIGFDPVEALVDNWSHDFTTALTAANGGPPPGSLTTDFYGSGTHSWAYWDREMCRALPMLLGALGVSYSPVACP
jgi:S-formylglutathione hydrolase FrmB